MTIALETYLGRITPWQSGRPRFVATVAGTLAPFVAASVVIASIPAAYDLDTAVGVQLDVTGAWIGRDRNVRLPIPAAYFSIDVAGLGLDEGSLKGLYDGQSGIYQLDDDTYRRLLRANILARRWDGTVPGAQAAFDAFFVDPATHVFVQDNAQVPYPVAFFSIDTAGAGLDEAAIYTGEQSANVGSVDVSMTIGVSGKIPPPLYLGLMAQGAIPIKPGGVQTSYAVTSVDGAPLFGIDVENEFVSGLDVGAMGVDPGTLLNA